VDLDSRDLSILEVLRGDGRASLREIAARTSMSTPTVSLHLSRMQKGGLIRGFVPLLDPAAAHEVVGLVKLRIPAGRLEEVARSLAKMDEVTGVFITTGRENLMVRVSAEDVEGVQKLLSGKIAKHIEGGLASSDIVTKVLKDVHSTRLKKTAVLNLKCDYCGQRVTSSRPYSVRAGPAYYYFCCRTCRKSYLDKHGQRVRQASARARRDSLRL
jgi:Lrp/AsnC family transcriptional regulator, leucine-responsive regulatory protein